MAKIRCIGLPCKIRDSQAAQGTSYRAMTRCFMTSSDFIVTLYSFELDRNLTKLSRPFLWVRCRRFRFRWFLTYCCTLFQDRR